MGDERAKHAIYHSFEPGPKMGEDIAVDFITLDGLKGFLFAAAKIGALLIYKPEEVDEGWLWSQAIDQCGEQAARIALRGAGVADPRFESYRQKALAAKPETNAKETKSLTYAQLKSVFLTIGPYWLGRWGADASKDYLERAAQVLLAAREHEDQIRHLRIFWRRPFPLDPSALLDLVLAADEVVARAAAKTLALITHPPVWELAFRLV